MRYRYPDEEPDFDEVLEDDEGAPDTEDPDDVDAEPELRHRRRLPGDRGPAPGV